MQRYKLLKVLGDGTFGTVNLAKNTDTGELVAIKRWVCSCQWCVYPYFKQNETRIPIMGWMSEAKRSTGQYKLSIEWGAGVGSDRM